MSLQLRNRIILAAILAIFTTNSFAISSSCFYGQPTGVSYNTVWHDAEWSFFDVYSSFDTAYMFTIIDGPTPGERYDNFPAGAGAEVTHYLNNPQDGSYEMEGGVWLDDGVPYAWGQCWGSADVTNTTYSGGICRRALGVAEVPETLFGITIPNDVVDAVEALLLLAWFDHENARVEKKVYGSTVQVLEKGFFPESGGDAIQAAVIYLADAVIPDNIATSNSYVDGEVNADDGWDCDMTAKSSTQYSAMYSSIAGATDEPYSLIFYNCTHWAAARQY